MAAIVDEAGHDLPDGHGGLLVIKRPWPAMMRTIWGDPERFKKTYFPIELGGKTYLAGDGAVRNHETGYFTITGRIDDVLNVSGHRMGTMEIESALVANPIVAEAAVVGKPDDTTGESICAFVVLKRSRPVGAEALQIAKELRDWVAKEIGPIAKPKEIRQDHAPPAARHRQGRGNHARHLHTGKPGHPGAIEAIAINEVVLFIKPLPRIRTRAAVFLWNLFLLRRKPVTDVQSFAIICGFARMPHQNNKRMQ
jgi:acyl-CoA synthetase (AMP-forming)/AMP-acid ligase II